MGVNTGDLIQVIDNQSYLGQQVLNVYYYRWSSAPVLSGPYLSQLNDSFQTTVMDFVADLQNDMLTHLSREWKNLSNNVDIFVDGDTFDGSNAVTEDTALPSYVSLGFLLQRDSLVTRNGYKRFAGLRDADVAGNSYTGGAPTIAAVETALASPLEVGIIEVAFPIIPKRPLVPPVGSYVYSSIISARFRTVGTQNSRKAGRGV